MDSIQHLFNRLFEHIDIGEKEKAQFMGMFMIGVYKSALGLLLELHGDNKEFVLHMNDFIEQSAINLPPEKKEMFKEALEKQKQSHIKIITDLLMKHSPIHIQKQLQANMRTYLK